MYSLPQDVRIRNTVSSNNNNNNFMPRDSLFDEDQAGGAAVTSITSSLCTSEPVDGTTVSVSDSLASDDIISSNNDSNHEFLHVTKKLGVLPLVVIAFYSVSGGPFGIEMAVRSAGNAVSLLGFLVLPLLWSLQEALMTAELGAAFPEAAGGVAWVEAAFGLEAAWMSGYLNWVSGATDNAIYPVLFLDYVVAAFEIQEHVMGPWTRWFLLSLCSSILAYITWRGLMTVGHMSMAICFLAMSPFVVLCIIGVFSVDPRRWLELPLEPAPEDGGPQHHATTFWGVIGAVAWRPFLNNLFWNGNSFDSVASFAAEVENPGVTLPRVLIWSVWMVTVCYMLPLLVTLGASSASQSDWVDGYLAAAASDIVGPWLGTWTVFSAGISNIAMFQAELSSDAFQLMGMADRGYLPAWCRTRSKHGTPTAGILIGTAVIVLMTLSDLDELIEMLNFQYAIAILFEYAAFLKLRISAADLVRPYKIPLGTTGCALFFFPPIVMTIVIMLLASLKTWALSVFVNLFGISLYRMMKRNKKVYEHVDVEITPP